MGEGVFYFDIDDREPRITRVTIGCYCGETVAVPDPEKGSECKCGRLYSVQDKNGTPALIVTEPPDFSKGTVTLSFPAPDPSDWAAGPTQIHGDQRPALGPVTLLTSKDGGETWAETKAEIVCPDCNGTKVYVGLIDTRPCPTCQGDR